MWHETCVRPKLPAVILRRARLVKGKKWGEVETYVPLKHFSEGLLIRLVSPASRAEAVSARVRVLELC